MIVIANSSRRIYTLRKPLLSHEQNASFYHNLIVHPMHSVTVAMLQVDGFTAKKWYFVERFSPCLSVGGARLPISFASTIRPQSTQVLDKVISLQCTFHCTYFTRFCHYVIGFLFLLSGHLHKTQELRASFACQQLIDAVHIACTPLPATRPENQHPPTAKTTTTTMIATAAATTTIS